MKEDFHRARQGSDWGLVLSTECELTLVRQPHIQCFKNMPGDTSLLQTPKQMISPCPRLWSAIPEKLETGEKMFGMGERVNNVEERQRGTLCAFSSNEKKGLKRQRNHDWARCLGLQQEDLPDAEQRMMKIWKIRPMTDCTEGTEARKKRKQHLQCCSHASSLPCVPHNSQDQPMLHLKANRKLLHRKQDIVDGQRNCNLGRGQRPEPHTSQRTPIEK